MARQDQKFRVVNYGIQNAEKQLWGQLYLPEVDEESEKIPLVIFCHGLGGSSDDMVPYASLLAQRGYAGYVFDFTGGSPSSRSGGNFHDMGLSTEINDLKAVYTNLCSLPRFSRIYLAGHSQGSVVAAMAARDLRPIDGLILLSPAFVMEEAWYLGTSAAQEYFDEKPGFAPGNKLHALVIDDSKLLDPWKLTTRERLERAIYHRQKDALKAVYANGRKIH